MRVNHHRAGQLLSPYLDGELLPREAAAVQEHLLECADCREAYERLRATKALLGELPVAEPPAEFWATVRRPEEHPPMTARLLWGHLAWLSPAGLARLLAARGPAVRRRVAWVGVAAIAAIGLALSPMIKGAVDRLHAAEIGVDLYVREHALQMTTQPLTDHAYLGVIVGDTDLALVGEPPRSGKKAP